MKIFEANWWSSIPTSFVQWPIYAWEQDPWNYFFGKKIMINFMKYFMKFFWKFSFLGLGLKISCRKWYLGTIFFKIFSKFKKKIFQNLFGVWQIWVQNFCKRHLFLYSGHQCASYIKYYPELLENRHPLIYIIRPYILE